MSTCSSCGHSNPEGSKFCNRCGASVQPSDASRAPTPDFRVPTPDSDLRNYTPRHLAEKILTSRAALEGERKQVTVFFADVKSSMELAEQLDAEEWHKVMDRFFTILSEGVHRFEGTVNQYTGDGIMALFGAPIAHEDHAQRACYAALHIQESLRAYADQLRLESGLNFAVRIGLNSGDVVVGKIGDDLRMDYTAQGQVVGLAARMEHIAEPGKVYLTENTARLAGGYFNLRDLGETRLKGLSHALRVYELEGVGTVRTRFDISRARGLSRFVGRAGEMGILLEALDATLAGEGRAVGIVAQAGQGKSRLCFEFVQHCRARGVRVYQAQSVAHDKGVPLLAVLQLLRAYFGITTNDDGGAARDRIAGRILLLDATLADSLPILFEFLGVPDPAAPPLKGDSSARIPRLFDLLQRLGRVRAGREAVVFLLEDLHWIDDASIPFIKHLLDDAPNSRTLLVANFRPELHADWLRAPHYREVALEPLGREEIVGLLEGLLGADPSLAVLPEWINERTSGNPFYVEEVVRALIEDGTLAGGRGAYRLVRELSHAGVPPTVHAILAARIDRLAEGQKEILQAASVIGKTFAETVLVQVLAGVARHAPKNEIEAALHALVDAEFIDEHTFHPRREYAFKHALTHEVAYGSQLADKRRSVHAATAAAIEAESREKLDEAAASIARHWEAAGEALPAARWYRRAADWIDARDVAGVIPYWKKIIALVEPYRDSEEARRLELSAYTGVLHASFRVGISVEEAERLYERGMELAELCNDQASAESLKSIRYRVLWSAGVVPHGDLPDADDIEDPETRLGVVLDTVFGQMVTGKMREAYAEATEAASMLQSRPELSHTMSGAALIGLRALVSTLTGRLDDADESANVAMEIARTHGFKEVLGWAHGWRSTLNLARGDNDAAVADGRRCLEIAYEIESTFSVGSGTLGLTSGLIARGDFDEAIALCEKSLERIRAQGAGVAFEAQILTNLAEAQVGRGDLEGAKASIESAKFLAVGRANLQVTTRIHTVHADLMLQMDGPQARRAIEAELDIADRLVEESGAFLWQPLVYRTRARLAAALGDLERRDAELQVAAKIYLEMGAPRRAQQVLLEA